MSQSPEKATKAETTTTTTTKNPTKKQANESISVDLTIRANIMKSLDIQIEFEWVDPSASASRTTMDLDMSTLWINKSETEADANKEFTKNLSPSMRLDDEAFAKNLCAKKFTVSFRAKSDKKLLDKIKLHYSPLLFSEKKPEFIFSSPSVRVPGLANFELKITANKSFFTPEFRKHLNPLQICVIAAKDLPKNKSKLIKYMPAYVSGKFLDGTNIKTHAVPSLSSKCEWMYKQVILLGLVPLIKLKETIPNTQIEFEVHDRDGYLKKIETRKERTSLAQINYPLDDVEQDPAQKISLDENIKVKPAARKKDKKIKTNDFGISKFSLQRFLETNTTFLKFGMPIVPAQMNEVPPYDSGYLNLAISKSEFSSDPHTNYFDSGSYLTVSFELAFPIGPVDVIPQDSNGRITEVGSSVYCGDDVHTNSNNINGEKLQPSSIAAIESNQSNKISNEPKKPPTGQKKSLLLDGGKGEKKKLNHFDGSPKKAFNMVNSQETPHFEQQQEAKITKVKPECPKAADDQSAIFERVVATFPSGCFYSRNDFARKIQQVNCRAFGKDDADALYLSLKVLSESEKQDLKLNIITGIEFIDEEYHTFILEGLAGKAIQEVCRSLAPEIIHRDRIQILKGTSLRFEKRLYSNFNVDIKKIWFERNVSEIIAFPRLYQRDQTPTEVYHTLKALLEIRKCASLKAVFTGNLFPSEHDIVMTIKYYGQTTTYIDANGMKTLRFENIDLRSSSICAIKPTAKFQSPEDEDDDESPVQKMSVNEYNKEFSSSAKKVEIKKIESASSKIKIIAKKNDIYNFLSKFDSSPLRSDRGTQGPRSYRVENRGIFRADPSNVLNSQRTSISSIAPLDMTRHEQSSHQQENIFKPKLPYFLQKFTEKDVAEFDTSIKRYLNAKRKQLDVYDNHRHGNRSARIQPHKDYVPVEAPGEQSARQNKGRDLSEDPRRRMSQSPMKASKEFGDKKTVQINEPERMQNKLPSIPSRGLEKTHMKNSSVFEYRRKSSFARNS